MRAIKSFFGAALLIAGAAAPACAQPMSFDFSCPLLDVINGNVPYKIVAFRLNFSADRQTATWCEGNCTVDHDLQDPVAKAGLQGQMPEKFILEATVISASLGDLTMRYRMLDPKTRFYEEISSTNGNTWEHYAGQCSVRTVALAGTRSN